VPRGVGRAHGAVSFVNALLCGQGCAAGIDWETTAELELEELAGPESRWTIAEEFDTPLVRAALRAGLARFAAGRRFEAELRLRSQLPWGRGLKSSSAVVGAILRAAEEALAPGPGAPADELALEVVRLHRELGLTATGGFDDALVSLEGGVVAADNREHRRLFAGEVPGSWSLLIALPATPHPPASTLLLRFLGYDSVGRHAIDLARRSEYLEAMRVNTETVESALGLSLADLRQQLEGSGAWGAGVSGLGPALAIVGPRDRVAGWEERLSQSGIGALRARFRPAGGGRR
jgi:shikimate kinase